MKTISKIQLLSKIGKILSKITYICCIVGFFLCVVGLISTIIGAETITIGGVTIESILETEADVNVNTLYVMLVAGIIICIGEAVLARFAENYFKKELKDGTPFTLSGAKSMMRLGILTMCIPVVVEILIEIAYIIMKNVLTGVGEVNVDMNISFGIGIMFIVTSLICRYGAEQLGNKDTNN